MTRMRCLFVAGLALLLGGGSLASDAPRIAIIIDDIGYRLEAGRRAIELPGPVSYAVLPGAPRADQLAHLAHERGKDVLLHLPLQATVDSGVGTAAGLHLDMNRRQFGEAFAEAFDSVPHVIGINNHRGSLLTRHPGHMRWLMEEIRARDNLFFVDSYTTHASVALQVARESGVAAAKRDVFLDPDPSVATVRREFERMKALASARGVVVAIGHPHAATMEVLEQEIPKLAAEGYQLVSISDLLREELPVVGDFVEPSASAGF